MRAFKIVHVNSNGRLYSLATNNMACVQYIPGKVVRAPHWLAEQGYYLTAFMDLEKLKTFWAAWGNTNREVWEIKGTGLRQPVGPMCYIQKLSDGIMQPLTDEWPDGTVMFVCVELIKRVEL